MNLENHMFHDKGISLLSSLSSHNLEKMFQRYKNKANEFFGANILSDFELAKISSKRILTNFYRCLKTSNLQRAVL